MSFVIDASAAVEYLLRTPLGARVSEIIEGVPLFAPELFDVEVLSILRRATFRRLISEERAAEAVNDLVAWPIERIAHTALVQQAWAYRDNVSAYDAFYVAAAATLDVALLTADGPLARAPLKKITVINVRLGS